MNAATMRAVRIHGWGDAPTVDEVAAPTRTEGETLVRVEAAAVAHLDRTVAGGDFGLKPALPYTGGVEGCGVVVESDSLQPGTRVMVRGGGLGLTRDGTWAEYVTAPSERVSALPDGLGPELGATFFVPVTTGAVALGAVGRLGHWSDAVAGTAADETVLIAGAAGAVGIVTAQLALRQGARVLGLVVDLEQAAALPAGVEPVLSSDEVVALRLREERPVTLLIDTLGGAGLADRIAWVCPGGRVASIGYVTGTDASLDLPNWLLQDVSLLPVNMIRRDREARAAAAELGPLLVSGELTLAVESFTFDEASNALALLGSGGLQGRAVLVPQGGAR